MNINGNEYSWASLSARFGGARLDGAKSIKYSDEIEGREAVYGASRKPRGRTRGRYKVGDCSLTLYLSDFKNLIASLGNGWGDVEGELVVHFEEGDEIHEHVLERVKLSGADHSAEEGTDAATVEIKLNVMDIRRDGLYLVAA